MRKSFLILLACALALPAAASAALLRTADAGALSVEDGRGKVVIYARGGVIGRFDTGSVTITDLSPDDPFSPTVFGDELPPRTLVTGGVQYRGTNVRFRLVGGRYRITVQGAGIALSAVGNGWVQLEGDGSRSPGWFSLDGDDCSLPRVKCQRLPDVAKRFTLGSGDVTERPRTSG